MIQPVMKKVTTNEYNEDNETISFWLNKSPEERMNAMGELHKQQLIIMGYKDIPHIKKCVNKVKVI